jgi:hypothetical protein
LIGFGNDIVCAEVKWSPVSGGLRYGEGCWGGKNYVNPDVLELRRNVFGAKEKWRCRAARYAQRS